jgi:HAD superfamily hydrolase (TIGR01509 family)
MALTHLGLLPYFEQILFAHELGIDKKDPAIFHKAAEIMGVKESDCTVFDDSVASCRSAKAAGMTVIGVYDEFFHVSWDEMQDVCDRTIRGFAELL